MDDPFECQVDFSYPKAFKSDYQALKAQIYNGVINYVLNNFVPEERRKSYFEFIEQCTNNDYSFSGKKALELGFDYDGNQISKEMISVINEIPHFMDNLNKPEIQQQLFNLFTFANEENTKLGICSLSEIKDSEVMWAMYGNNYRGYCVEYSYEDINHPKEMMFPVEYTNKRENNIIDVITKLFINSMVDAFSEGKIKVDKNQSVRTFLYKSEDWRFQKEWRLVGEPNARCQVKKISAVYLGNKVSNIHERRVLKIAREQNFSVYKVLFTKDDTKIHFICLKQ